MKRVHDSRPQVDHHQDDRAVHPKYFFDCNRPSSHHHAKSDLPSIMMNPTQMQNQIMYQLVNLDTYSWPITQ